MNPAQIHTDKQPLPKLAQQALTRLLDQYKPIEEKAA